MFIAGTIKSIASKIVPYFIALFKASIGCSSNCMYNMEKINDDNTARTIYITENNTFFMIYYNTTGAVIIVL